MIYKLAIDRKTVIYYRAKGHFQREFILIITHKKVENMNVYFGVYDEFAILNRTLAFPVSRVWTEMRIFT